MTELLDIWQRIKEAGEMTEQDRKEIGAIIEDSPELSFAFRYWESHG